VRLLPETPLRATGHSSSGGSRRWSPRPTRSSVSFGPELGKEIIAALPDKAAREDTGTITPSDFGDPRVPIAPSTLRVNPPGLAVAFESPVSGLIAVLPPLGQTPEEYIRLRTAAEVRRFRRVRLALLLSAAFVLSVILAAFAFGPGSAAHPYALSGIGACAL